MALLEVGRQIADVHQQVRVDQQEACDVLRALDVSGQPIHRVRVAGKHGTRDGKQRGWGIHLGHGGHSSTTVGSTLLSAGDFSSSTHVSLLPPPWLLFTTSDPLRSATRVSPPGITTGFSPKRMYGRRSTRRPSKWSSIRLGCWLSSMTGWATKFRGSALILSAKACLSAL